VEAIHDHARSGGSAAISTHPIGNDEKFAQGKTDMTNAILVLIPHLALVALLGKSNDRLPRNRNYAHVSTSRAKQGLHFIDMREPVKKVRKLLSKNALQILPGTASFNPKSH
jgi:predicted RNase H-like nuclease